MDLRASIDDADMILIGIGEAFQEKFNGLSDEDKEVSAIDKRAYLNVIESDDCIEAYNKLAKMIEGKNYFVVSLCNDDKIYKSELNHDKIVTPCGTYNTLQCENGCSNVLIDASEVDDMETGICSECGGKLKFNIIEEQPYNEKGYLPMWEKYTRWLQGSLNKKVCILELGVGFKYPSVIRWPFEKIAFFNLKANFIRVHETLYQLSDELKDKGVAIQENPITFLMSK